MPSLFKSIPKHFVWVKNWQTCVHSSCHFAPTKKCTMNTPKMFSRPKIKRFSKFKVLPDVKRAVEKIPMVFEALSLIITAVSHENDRIASEFLSLRAVFGLQCNHKGVWVLVCDWVKLALPGRLDQSADRTQTSAPNEKWRCEGASFSQTTNQILAMCK